MQREPHTRHLAQGLPAGGGRQAAHLPHVGPNQALHKQVAHQPRICAVV